MSEVLSGSNTLSGTFSIPGGIEVDGELFLVDATVNASVLAIEASATVATIDSLLLPGGSTTIDATVTNDGVLEFAGANLGDRLVLAGSVSGTGSIELFQNGPTATGGITVEGAVSQGQQVVFEPDTYLGPAMQRGSRWATGQASRERSPASAPPAACSASMSATRSSW